MDALIAAWCARHLGSPAVEQFFGMQRLSAVHGVRLADGREVVLKVRPAHPRQAACVIVQRAAWQAGVPCPEPLAGPHPLADGVSPVLAPADEGEPEVDARLLAVSAESWEGEGEAGLGDLGSSGWGALLARMIASAPPVGQLPPLDSEVPWFWWDHGVPGRTWPPPLSARWDPHRIDSDIDPVIHEAARRARARLLRPDAATLSPVAGHSDFEAQNCRWVVGAPGASPRLVVHDWDSVVARPEAMIAGNSAVTFASVAEPVMTSLAQNDDFLDAYARERDRPWTPLELELAHAAGVWVGAYNAAFEHLKDGPGPVTAALHEQAEERLRRAGA